MTARALLEVADEMNTTEMSAVSRYKMTGWVAKLRAIASSLEGQAVGFQCRHRSDTANPWSDWSDPQGMRNVDHYLTRPQTFDIRYVYADRTKDKPA